MVTLRRRTTKGETAYYLSHTYRQGGKVKYRETYIGQKIPTNVNKIKNEFLQEIYKEKWFGSFETIKKAYSAVQKTAPPSIKAKNLEAFAIRFTYDTSKIEGSRLTLRETGALLTEGITPPNRSIADVKEAETHRSIFYKMLEYKNDLSIGIVLAWHKELLANTERDIAGRIREYDVYITNSKFRPPGALEVQAQILEFFRWYDREEPKMNPVELAARAHLKFVTIHPFGNGNGRIGRIIMNFILNRNGYPMMDIRYEDKMGYYRALERSQTKRDDGPFVQWVFKKYLKDNKGYLGVGK